MYRTERNDDRYKEEKIMDTNRKELSLNEMDQVKGGMLPILVVGGVILVGLGAGAALNAGLKKLTEK